MADGFSSGLADSQASLIEEHVLSGDIETKRLAQDKLVEAILPTGFLPKTNLIQ